LICATSDQEIPPSKQRSLTKESADVTATIQTLANTSLIWPLLCTSSGSLQAFNNLNTTDHPSVPVVSTVVDAGVGSSSVTYSNVATMVSSAVSQAREPILARLDQQQQQQLRRGEFILKI